MYKAKTVTPVCEHLKRQSFIELFVNVLKTLKKQFKRTNITHIVMFYGNATRELVVLLLKF